MGYRVDSVDLKGDEKCVLCGTEDILDREYREYTVQSDDGDFICEECLFGSDKTWKFRVSPHPYHDYYNVMVTDDFEDVKDWIDNDCSDEGENKIRVNWEYESLESFIDRKLDEKEDFND